MGINENLEQNLHIVCEKATKEQKSRVQDGIKRNEESIILHSQ